jgi:hypothetical protein
MRGSTEEEVAEEAHSVGEVETVVFVEVEEGDVRRIGSGAVAARQAGVGPKEKEGKEADAVGDVEDAVLVAIAGELVAAGAEEEAACLERGDLRNAREEGDHVPDRRACAHEVVLVREYDLRSVRGFFRNLHLDLGQASRAFPGKSGDRRGSVLQENVS